MKDFILCKPGALPKSECENLINNFETKWVGRQEEGLIGPGVLDTTMKQATEVFFYLGQEFSPFELDYLKYSIEDYIKEFPFLDDLPSWGIYNVFKMQKYKPGEGFFSLHCENHPTPIKTSFEKRLIAWMIYLNDVRDGGYTEFPTQDKKFQPRCGDILMWPAYWTHPHRGIVSRTETKYILTGWYNFYNLNNK